MFGYSFVSKFSRMSHSDTNLTTFGNLYKVWGAGGHIGVNSYICRPPYFEQWAPLYQYCPVIGVFLWGISTMRGLINWLAEAMDTHADKIFVFTYFLVRWKKGLPLGNNCNPCDIDASCNVLKKKKTKYFVSGMVGRECS